LNVPQDRLTIGRALREHWPEYLMEAWGLGTFMVSAGLFATLLEYPGSPVREAIENADLRRGLMGLAMGLNPGHGNNDLANTQSEHHTSHGCSPSLLWYQEAYRFREGDGPSHKCRLNAWAAKGTIG
jgi:hypothetical protein